MKFLYVGDYPDDANTITAYGREFPRGVAVEVPEALVGKASNNHHFVAVLDPCGVDVTLTASADAKVAVIEADGSKSDVSEDGTSDVSDDGKTLDKAALITKAEEFGITIDKRWSAARIADAIIAHAEALGAEE